MNPDCVFFSIIFLGLPTLVIGTNVFLSVRARRRRRAKYLALPEASCPLCGRVPEVVEDPCSRCGWTPSLEHHPTVGPWVEAWRLARVAVGELEAEIAVGGDQGQNRALRGQHRMAAQSAAFEASQLQPELGDVLAPGQEISLYQARRLAEVARKGVRDALVRAEVHG